SLPVRFGARPASLAPDNKLAVEVSLPTSDSEAWPEWPITEVPHGKQSWYGPIGGIWQSVELEARAARHIGHLAINATPPRAVLAEVLLSAESRDAVVRAAVIAADGITVTESEMPVTGTRVRVPLTVDRPHLWSPDSPALYRLRAELRRGNELVDAVSESFGFRSIE